MKISVIIPVYKNTKLFLDNLTHNMKFIKEDEIIIIDDASGEDLGQLVQKQFPQCIVVENSENIGFSKTVNRGVSASHGDYIFLLNSDVRLIDDSYKKAIDLFTDDSVFAVTCAQKEQSGEIVGKNALFFKSGFIGHRRVSELSAGINGWAEGGSSIIDRKKFDALGGFDPLYSPFYWEDIDLSYRAKKRGWKVLFEPSIVVEHHHESTIGKYYTKDYVKAIAYRNQFIFMWKNVPISQLIIHKIYLPIALTRAFVTGDWPLIKGYISAVGSIGKILMARIKN